MKTNRRLLAAMMLSLLAGAVQHLHAQGTDPNFEYYKEPGQYPTRAYLNQHFNEHIDPFSGRLQHHYVDLYIPGNGGFDLKIQRSYTNPDEAGNSELSVVGTGWTMHFGRVLRKSSIALCNVNFAGGVSMPVLELPDGSRQILFRDDAHFPGTAAYITTSRWRAECMSGGLGLRVHSPDGTRYEMTQPGIAPFGQNAWYTTQIIDRNNNSMTIGYQTVGGLTVISSITTSDGRSVTYAYTSIANQTHLTSISEGARTWQYGYTTAPTGVYLTQVTPPVGGAWQYLYNMSGTGPGLGSMSRVTYPQGGAINYSYILKSFAAGVTNTVVSQKTSSDGGTWTFSYTPSTGFNVPDTTTVTAPNGAITYKHVGYGTVGVGTYWRVGLLTEKQIGTVQTETYAWTSQLVSNQTNQRPGSTLSFDPTTNAPVLSQKVVSRNGNTHTSAYSNFDEFGNARTVAESSSGFTRTISLTYQNNTSLWIIRQVKDETISMAGFPNFSVTRTIGVTGNVTQENRFGVPTNFGYDGQGNMTSRTNARGFPTSFGNYFRGIPRSETHPAGVAISRVVSNAGNVTSETDGKGDVVGYGYDALNRITSINYPVLNDVTVSYPTASRMTITRGTLTQTVNYDGFGRMASVSKTDSLSPTQNSTVTLGHNPLGQRTFVSYPNTPSVGTSMSYDMLARLNTMTHPGPTSRIFNYGATTMAVTNERGIVHTYSYRAFGDPDRRELMGISVPAPDQAASVVIARNPIGRITSVTQGGKSRNYGYNSPLAPGNFLTSITEPETGTTTFGRDQIGNMTSRSVSGTSASTFVYDGLDRLIQTNHPGLPTVVRTYYGDSLLQTAEFGTTLREFTYDPNKNLTLDRLTVDGRTYSVVHSYAGNDGRDTTTFPSGTVVSYSPNGFGRPRAAAPFAGIVDFHPSGELKTIAFANGVTTSISLNARLWPQQLTSVRAGFSPTADLKYTYDGLANVISFEDFVDTTNTMPVLQYDRIDRLVLADTTVEARRFSYDGAGNITTQTIGGQAMTYNYDTATNRLASISNAPKPYSFGYDLLGNVVINNSTPGGFQYNSASQMTCAKCGQSDQSAFVYDGLSMRVRMQKAGITTYFMHGLDGQLLLEDTPVTSGGGAETREYAYLQGKQIGVKTISRVATTTTPGSSSISGTVGGPITMTVNISGSSPTGTVTFREGTTVLGTATVTNGSASLTLSTLPKGTHTITAEYSGDANNAPSTTTFQVTINDLSWLPAILQLLLDD
jgi:YD repeat-containing protein